MNFLKYQNLKVFHPTFDDQKLRINFDWGRRKQQIDFLQTHHLLALKKHFQNLSGSTIISLSSWQDEIVIIRAVTNKHLKLKISFNLFIQGVIFTNIQNYKEN